MIPNISKSSEQPIRPERFNPIGQKFTTDPYPILAAYQRRAPFQWVPEYGFWLSVRYKDVAHFASDKALVSSDHLAYGSAASRSHSNSAQKNRRCPIEQIRQHWMLTADVPKHTRLRNTVRDVFQTNAIKQHITFIDQTIETLLTKAMDQGGFDVISDLAYPLPIATISHLLNIPEEDRYRFHDWAKKSGVLLEAIGPDLLPQANVIAEEAADYFRHHMNRKNFDTNAPLFKSLMKASTRSSMTQEESTATAVLLFVTGHETTVNLIGNSVLTLLQHHEQWEQIRHDQALLPQAINETLRFEPPVKFIARFAKQPFEFNGSTVQQGDLIHLCISAANRDPQQFENPNAFNIHRISNRHLAFGRGIHYCIGAELAKLQATRALYHLSQKPALALLTQRPRWQRSFIFRKLEELPVAFQH